MYKLIFFVPIQSAEEVKNAIFNSGGGRLGNYSHCSFETSGVGQFLPNKMANPAIGEIGEIERVDELKVEILCEDIEVVKSSIQALKDSHPYEEPAYEVLTLLKI